LDIPFHSYDLFEDHNSESYLKLSEAKNFISAINEFLKIIPIQVKVIHSQKNKFRRLEGLKYENNFKGTKRNKKKKEILYVLSATKLFYWFAEYLEKNDSKGRIVVDSRKGLDQFLLYAYVNCKEMQQRRNAKEVKLALLAKKRLNSITFAEKTTLTGGLEVVDLISYSFFHAIDIERRMLNYEELKLSNIVKLLKLNVIQIALKN
jgi:hypothetical protein